MGVTHYSPICQDLDIAAFQPYTCKHTFFAVETHV